MNKLYHAVTSIEGFPGGSVVENPPTSAGDAGLIPGSGRPLEKEMATHSSILACEISWTEEPGRLQSMVLQKSQTGLKWLNNNNLNWSCYGNMEWNGILESSRKHEQRLRYTVWGQWSGKYFLFLPLKENHKHSQSNGMTYSTHLQISPG